MLDKLKDLDLRYEDLESQLGDPRVYGDAEKLRQVNRELKELLPVVETYRAYQAADSRRREAEVRAARRHFGLVFQQFNLFPQYSVLRNVTLAPTLNRLGTAEEIDARARALIDRVGLTDKLDSYPGQLSGGQQQRVAIARALALAPDILCFDEPTSALDPELTSEVLSVIRGLKSHDSTMVVVTHEMEFARSVADQVIFMANGVIEEAGTPDEVFGNPKSPLLQSFLCHGSV